MEPTVVPEKALAIKLEFVRGAAFDGDRVLLFGRDAETLSGIIYATFGKVIWKLQLSGERSNLLADDLSICGRS